MMTPNWNNWNNWNIGILEYWFIRNHTRVNTPNRLVHIAISHPPPPHTETSIYNEEESRTICKKLLAKGDKCHHTDECPFNTVCTGDQKNEGTCVDYFSLGIGETSYDERACASGRLYKSNHVCAEFTVTDSKCEQSGNDYYCISSILYRKNFSIKQIINEIFNRSKRFTYGYSY